MNFVIEFWIIFRHRLFTKNIYKDLSRIFINLTENFNSNNHYINILQTIYSLITKYTIIEENREIISKEFFIKSLNKTGKGSRIALVYFILSSSDVKKQFSSSSIFSLYRLRICEIVECIHNLSLVVDDIIDNDKTRRNEPCIHVKYGQCGVKTYIGYWLDLIFYLIMDLPVNEMSKKNCLSLFDKTSSDIIKYIELEVKWEKNKISVDWNSIDILTIKEIYNQKTVRIFMLCFEFIQETLGSKLRHADKYVKIITELGFYLQRINDLENFSINNENYLSDLRNKRIVLLNYNDKILNSNALLNLRYHAYKSNSVSEDINNYYSALQENNILQQELNDLIIARYNISTEIENLFNRNYHRVYLKLIFEMYFKKLLNIKFGYYETITTTESIRNIQ